MPKKLKEDAAPEQSKAVFVVKGLLNRTVNIGGLNNFRIEKDKIYEIDSEDAVRKLADPLAGVVVVIEQKG